MLDFLSDDDFEKLSKSRVFFLFISKLMTFWSKWVTILEKYSKIMFFFFILESMTILKQWGKFHIYFVYFKINDIFTIFRI